MWPLWVMFGLGVWLIASPFVLGYSHVPLALWNSIIAGIVLVGLTIYLIIPPWWWSIGWWLKSCSWNQDDRWPK